MAPNRFRRPGALVILPKHCGPRRSQQSIAALAIPCAATATASASIAAAGAVALAASPAAARSPRPGFIDRETPALMVAAVEVFDGSLCLLIAVHLDEAEAAAPP